MLGAIRKPLAKVANTILDNEPAENLLYARHLRKLRKAASKVIDSSLPVVTVVVPIYNVESYVEVCLLSLAAQTHRNVRVIMVDDGSTDGSAAIAKRFAKKFPNFSLVWAPPATPAFRPSRRVTGFCLSTPTMCFP
jgi:cellulose synthase/poly-beta-1,6-N-acetylglucosamine synthase-like glycosyltransferase